jgi:hypothetical protein
MRQTQYLDVDPESFIGLPPDEAEAAAPQRRSRANRGYAEFGITTIFATPVILWRHPPGRPLESSWLGSGTPVLGQL